MSPTIFSTGFQYACRVLVDYRTAKVNYLYKSCKDLRTLSMYEMLLYKVTSRQKYSSVNRHFIKSDVKTSKILFDTSPFSDERFFNGRRFASVLVVVTVGLHKRGGLERIVVRRCRKFDWRLEVVNEIIFSAEKLPSSFNSEHHLGTCGVWRFTEN